jgi:glycosyltransferase involved in cell wall biosynthesis
MAVRRVSRNLMRILYHHRTLGDGAEGIHVREMVQAFRRLGHEVKVIGPVGEVIPGQSRKWRILDWTKRHIPAAFYEILELGYTLYALWRTRREIRTFRPDFIYERYIIFNAGTTLGGKSRRVPVCLEVNAPLALERSGEPDERLIFRRLAFAIERWVCSNATRTIVVSTPLKDYLESTGVPAGQCTVMPNGVDPARFAPRPKDPDLLGRLHIPPDCVVVGFTGVLRSWHGLDMLLTAMGNVVRQGCNAVLLVVGDGPYRPVVDGIVAKECLGSHVRVTGRVPHQQVPDYVALFDVAVSPRATFYASPMKVLEYMALGKAVLVPGTPNFLDIIDERINGVTFPDGSAAGLETALVSLCKSPQTCRELGAQARKKVEARLNWAWNAQEVCRLISTARAT